jgi:hypothetical protein
LRAHAAATFSRSKKNSRAQGATKLAPATGAHRGNPHEPKKDRSFVEQDRRLCNAFSVHSLPPAKANASMLLAHYHLLRGPSTIGSSVSLLKSLPLSSRSKYRSKLAHSSQQATKGVGLAWHSRGRLERPDQPIALTHSCDRAGGRRRGGKCPDLQQVGECRSCGSSQQRRPPRT